MLTQEEAVDIHALHRRGISISEIARITGRDRKTIRSYLIGKQEPGKRKKPESSFEPFVEYVSARLIEDPHLFAQTLFDELLGLGFPGSYQTLTRQVRARGLRPACQACAHVTKRANAVIEHPPGEETQFDWVELPDPPTGWAFPRKTAYVLVGSLPFSGKWRAVICPSLDQAHLMHAITVVVTELGGVSRQWRFDRMTQVIKPGSNDVTANFGAFAKHFAVQVVACRPRSGNRKGVVEKNNHTLAQRWWRTLPDDLTLEQAQQSLTSFAESQDSRQRRTQTGWSTPTSLFCHERLQPVPVTMFPVVVVEQRQVSRQALIEWRGNRYSVPPEFVFGTVNVSARLGKKSILITTGEGATIAQHTVHEDGLGMTVRQSQHVTALETLALASAPPGRAHRKKERIPPGERSRAAAAQLTGPTRSAEPAQIIDLSIYEAIARGRNTLS